MQSWVYPGPQNWLYGGMASCEWFQRHLPMEHEHRLSLGVVTPLLCAAGLWARRRDWGIRTIMALPVVLVMTVTWWKLPGIPPLWKIVYENVPGADALRMVTRMGMLLIIPAAIGFALALDSLLSRGRPAVRSAAIILALFCLMEQFTATPSYDKQATRDRVARLARKIDPKSRVFFYSRGGPGAPPPWLSHLDAMWAGLAAEKPTVNGYTARLPPHWPFRDNEILASGDLPRCRLAIRAWAARHGLDFQDIQWIHHGSDAAPAPASGDAPDHPHGPRP
jgi:hypothetical protein